MDTVAVIRIQENGPARKKLMWLREKEGGPCLRHQKGASHARFSASHHVIDKLPHSSKPIRWIGIA